MNNVHVHDHKFDKNHQLTVKFDCHIADLPVHLDNGLDWDRTKDAYHVMNFSNIAIADRMAIYGVTEEEAVEHLIKEQAALLFKLEPEGDTPIHQLMGQHSQVKVHLHGAAKEKWPQLLHSHREEIKAMHKQFVEESNG